MEACSGFDRRWIADRVGSVVVNRDDSGENTCHVAVATMGRLAGLYSLPSTVAVALWRSVEALPMVPTAADPAAMVLCLNFIRHCEGSVSD